MPGGDFRYDNYLIPPFAPGETISEERWNEIFKKDGTEKERPEEVSLDGKRTVRKYNI